MVILAAEKEKRVFKSRESSERSAGLLRVSSRNHNLGNQRTGHERRSNTDDSWKRDASTKREPKSGISH